MGSMSRTDGSFYCTTCRQTIIGPHYCPGPRGGMGTNYEMKSQAEREEDAEAERLERGNKGKGAQ